MPDMRPGLQTRPGQYIHRREGGPGEFREAIQWIIALWMIRGATILSVAWALWLLGPRNSGLALSGVVALAVFAARDRDDDVLPDNVAVVLLMLLALFAALWLAVGGELAEIVWPVPMGARPWRWPWYWQALLLVPSAAWLSVRSVADYRVCYEVTDPNWPPPVSPRAPYVGPGQPGALFDLPPEGSAPERVVSTVPRPVVIGDGSQHRIDSASIQAALSQRLSAERNGGRALEKYEVATPDGDTVRYGDLVRFVRQIPERGASYSEWSDLWDHEYWGRVVDVCSTLGIVSERKPRHKTRVLVGDWQRSVALLSQLMD